MATGGMGTDVLPANVIGGGPYVTDGAWLVTGGGPPMTGGAPNATGGAPTASGGAPEAMGGAPTATGGGPLKTGGATGNSTRLPQPGQSVSRPAIDASICAVAPQLGQPNCINGIPSSQVVYSKVAGTRRARRVP
jgi:hypothetical protein